MLLNSKEERPKLYSGGAPDGPPWGLWTTVWMITFFIVVFDVPRLLSVLNKFSLWTSSVFSDSFCTWTRSFRLFASLLMINGVGVWQKPRRPHNLRFRSSGNWWASFPAFLRVLGFTLMELALVIPIPESTTVSRTQCGDSLRLPFLGL